ncbi:toprim domain-containing protein [Runella sp.]|uniref:toprim domain-containing protein n=1 Tax=Runella sp. TaxID=1960881 RepID=UPI003D0F9944
MGQNSQTEFSSVGSSSLQSMISTSLIQQAQAVPIVDYLASQGFEPLRATGKEFAYLSPLRHEHEASFFVNTAKNRFTDFAHDDYKGDVIRLVQLLEGLNFPMAVSRLLDFKGKAWQRSESLFLSAAKTESASPSTQTDITFPVQHPALINYLKQRGIPYSLGKKYLHEVVTRVDDKEYFSVGFRNDSNGFAIRNRYHKGNTGPQDITTLDIGNRGTVAVFEGFFDFLSALVWFGLETPRISTVVLNSTSNRKRAVEFLSQFEKVNCFLDRDKAGVECLRILEERDGLNISDFSTVYDGFKDFNKFLMGKS